MEIYQSQVRKNVFEVVQVVLILFFFYSCGSQQNTQQNCADYHTGVFKVDDAQTNESYIFIRGSDYQVEIKESTGLQKRLQIEWVDECSYRLINGTNEYLVTIDRVTVNGAKTTTTSNFATLKYSCTMKRLGDVADWDMEKQTFN